MAQDDEGVITNLGKTVSTLPSMVRVLELLMIVMTVLLLVVVIFTIQNQGAVKADVAMAPVEVSMEPINVGVNVDIPFIDRMLDALGIP